MRPCYPDEESVRDEDSLETLSRRIARLEQSNRRLRCGAALLSCVVGVIVVAGAQKRPVPDTIEAREFVMLNADGKCRAKLGGDGLSKAASLWFFGEEAASTATLTDFSLSFRRTGVEGADQLMELNLRADGAGELSFWDNKGKQCCALGNTKDRVPYVTLRDQNEKIRMGMTLNPEMHDAPDLHLMDSKEKIRAGIGMGAADLPKLYLRYDESREAANLAIYPDSSVGLRLDGKEGKEQVQLLLDKGGDPNLRMLARDKNVLFKAP